jgi:adenylate kinase
LKMIVCVSGTPGTGKTTVAKRYAKQHHLQYIPVQDIIKTKKVYESYDSRRKCYVVPTEKLNIELIALIKEFRRRQYSKILKARNKKGKKTTIKKNQSAYKGLVFDSHLSHYLPARYVDLCIITRCSLPVLRKRLAKRKYAEQKIRDNLEAEIFEVCLQEARERGHKIKVTKTG